MPFEAVYLLAQTPLASPTASLEAHFKEMNVPALTACGIIILWAFICWARLVASSMHLRRCARADEKFLNAHQQASHSLEVFQDNLSFESSPRHTVYLVASREMAFHLMGTDSLDKNFSIRLRAAGRITPSQMDSVRKVQERTAEFTSRELGAVIGGEGIAVLPFLGVLGALLSVLVDVSAGASNTSLVVSSVVPMALAVVAYIPLMLWYNGLLRRLAEMSGYLGDFAVELATQFDRAFVDHRKPLESLPSLGSMVPSDGPNFSLPPSDTSRSLPVIAKS